MSITSLVNNTHPTNTPPTIAPLTTGADPLDGFLKPTYAVPVPINSFDRFINLMDRFVKAGNLLKKGVDLNHPFASVRNQHALGPDAGWQQKYSWLNDRLITINPKDLPAFQKDLQLEEVTKNDLFSLINQIKKRVDQQRQQLNNIRSSDDGSLEKFLELEKVVNDTQQEIMPWLEKFDKTHRDFKLLRLPIDKLDRLGDLVQKHEMPCRLLNGSMGDLLNIMFKNMLASLFDEPDDIFSSSSGIDNTDQADMMKSMMSQFSSSNLSLTNVPWQNLSGSLNANDF